MIQQIYLRVRIIFKNSDSGDIFFIENIGL